MATSFGVRSWLWVMALINCLYAQTFAKRSGRTWVTQWPYPWRNGSDKFLQQLRRDLQRRIIGTNLRVGHRLWTDYGLCGSYPSKRDRTHYFRLADDAPGTGEDAHECYGHIRLSRVPSRR